MTEAVEGDLSTVPYESTEDPKHLPAHLERIAQRDYVGVNEGYWVLRDAAVQLRDLRASLSRAEAERDEAVKALGPFAAEYNGRRCRDEKDHWPPFHNAHAMTVGDLRMAADLCARLSRAVDKGEPT